MGSGTSGIPVDRARSERAVATHHEPGIRRGLQHVIEIWRPYADRSTGPRDRPGGGVHPATRDLPIIARSGCAMRRRFTAMVSVARRKLPRLALRDTVPSTDIHGTITRP